MSSTRSDTRKKKQNKLQNNHKEHEEADTDAVVPTSTDVLCGRGRTYFSHPGNRQFREIVGKSLGAYLDAPTRTQKSKIVKKITIEALENGARFLKQKGKSKSWYVAGQELAKNKVGHALRDASQDKSRSIKNIHLDLMQKSLFEQAELARLTTISATTLSVVDASRTSLCAIPDVIYSASDICDRDVKHVAGCHGEIEDVSSCTNDVSPDTSVGPTPITHTTMKNQGLLLTDDCSLYKEIQELSQRESSPSSSYSSLDVYLEVVNDIDIQALDDCLAAVQQGTVAWDSTPH